MPDKGLLAGDLGEWLLLQKKGFRDLSTDFFPTLSQLRRNGRLDPEFCSQVSSVWMEA